MREIYQAGYGRRLSKASVTLLALAFCKLSGAATTQLSDIPLANAGTATILPNIMFILDDSGSMAWNYLPDGEPSGIDKYCSGINLIYYNPAVNYVPPKNADGTSKTSYNTLARWQATPKDGYGALTSDTTDLTDDWQWNGWAWVHGARNYSFYYNSATKYCKSSTSSQCQATQTSTYNTPRVYCTTKVEINTSTTSYPGANGETRTYDEEMTNFANWYAWYRTRIQVMKTAMSLAFADVRGTPNTSDPTDQNYLHARVGFTTINERTVNSGARYLPIANFDSAQKSSFYSKMFAIDPDGNTPLLGALSKAGRLYAGTVGTDPIQYSCQRNFTILTTDGYWNQEETGYGAYKENNTTLVGDQDGVSATAVTRPEYEPYRSTNTLADVAYYYYHNDLRSSMTNNVPPAGTNEKVDDQATWQHMTTFTVGLGANGTLTYVDGYKTATSGDYYSIAQGSGKNWPNARTNTGKERIDDLWHAAVNGRGTYFSARDPESLVDGLTTALGAMKSSTGSGAAAATSNLQPTAGDNFIYIANYRTVNWDGDLSAYSFDLSTGAVLSTLSWAAAAKLKDMIAGDGNSDTRTIYSWDSATATKLESFTWSNLSTAQQNYLKPSVLTSKLSQYDDWSDDDKTAATGESLLKYLRGQDRNEDQDRDASYGTYYRLYRDREKIMGDIVHSQPIYVQESFYDYYDTGYSSFKTSIASRSPTVYVAANDGMLHAFNASDGTERWAYIPPVVLPNLYRLADKAYATNHRFFIDGPIAISDIKDGSSWKTILVGALGKGGRGYYALDITDPSAPKGLWNYTADDNSDVGYTYGLPIVTKLTDGTWVVVVASGYNNVPEGSAYSDADGHGHVFVLNAATGALIRDIDTNVGSTSTPAGLAYLNVKVNDFQTDNTAVAAYGGDLLGNMWRFDLDTGATSKVVDLPGTNQPITVAPEIGEVDGKTVLYFGTGRYLGADDMDDTPTQSFYAIKDDGTTEVNVVSQMTKQTMSTSGVVTGTASIDWSDGFGWYLDLPTSKERVNLQAQLFFGTILFASIIPTATECEPGGTGNLYALDALSGFAVEGATWSKRAFSSPIVGLTVYKLPGGTAKVSVVTADGKVNGTVPGAPSGGIPPEVPIGAGSGSSGRESSGWRVMWRELTN